MAYNTQNLIRLWKEREQAQVTLVTVEASGSSTLSSGFSRARDALVATRSNQSGVALRTTKNPASFQMHHEELEEARALARVESVDVATTLEEQKGGDEAVSSGSTEPDIQDAQKEEAEALSLSEAEPTDVENEEEQNEERNVTETGSIEVGKLGEDTTNLSEKDKFEALRQAKTLVAKLLLQAEANVAKLLFQAETENVTSIVDEPTEGQMKTLENADQTDVSSVPAVLEELADSGLPNTMEEAVVNMGAVEYEPVGLTTTRKRLESLKSLEDLEIDAMDVSLDSPAHEEAPELETFSPVMATCATDRSIHITVPPNQSNNAAACPKPEKRKWLKRMFKSKKDQGSSSSDEQVSSDSLEKPMKKSKPNKLVKKDRPARQTAAKTPAKKTTAQSSRFSKFRRPAKTAVSANAGETAHLREESAPSDVTVMQETAVDCEVNPKAEEGVENNPEVVAQSSDPVMETEPSGSIPEIVIQDTSITESPDADKENSSTTTSEWKPKHRRTNSIEEMEKINEGKTSLSSKFLSRPRLRNWSIPIINIGFAPDKEASGTAGAAEVDGNLLSARKRKSKRLSLRRMILTDVLNRKDKDMDGELEEDL